MLCTVYCICARLAFNQADDTKAGSLYCLIMLFPNSTATAFISEISVCMLACKIKLPACKKWVVAFLPLLFQCTLVWGLFPCGLPLSQEVIVFLSNKIGFCCICTSLFRRLDLRGCNGPLIPGKATRKKGIKCHREFLSSEISVQEKQTKKQTKKVEEVGEHYIS